MGGFGSGGRRVGAGRKAKSAKEHALSGWSGRRKRTDEKSADAKSAAASASLPILPPPDDLTGAARDAWVRLAPKAARARTLTSVEDVAFRDLCMAIAIRDRMWAQIEEDGLTFRSTHVEFQKEGADVEVRTEACEIKKHPLLNEHRGWQQKVDAAMARFKLAPMGKEVVPPEPVKDVWSDFDDGETAH